MLFHELDENSSARLLSCQKRANKFGKDKVIKTSKDIFFEKVKCACLFKKYVGDQESYLQHPLAILWENIKYFLQPKEYLQNWHLLDYFALRVDEYLKDNMLDTDEHLKVMLKEWNNLIDLDCALLKKVSDAGKLNNQKAA